MKPFSNLPVVAKVPNVQIVRNSNCLEPLELLELLEHARFARGRLIAITMRR